jgi:hypothetical protein
MKSAPSHAKKALIGALVVIAGACFSDDVNGPPTAANAKRMAHVMASCDNWCPIAASGLPFRAARYSSDSSAVDIHVASLQLAVRPGASAVLKLEASSDWWSAIADTAILYVALNGVRRAVALGALRWGLELARFSDARTVELRIDLPRQFSNVPTGDVQLLLHLSSASIVDSYTPWAPASSQTASALVAGACPFNAPGTWCGVVVGIAPFSQGTHWTETGFQSEPGNGASSTIHITFNRDVIRFSVDVYDPDLPGNRVIAYNAQGGIVDSVDVPGDGTSGTLTIESVSVTGGPIRSVDLVPASADYVAYDAAAFDTAFIVVACLPSPVQRGSQVTCTASPPEGASAFTVNQWRFEGHEIGVPIVEADTSLQWIGTAATSGTVTASGTVDGILANGSDSLKVSNRNWLSDTVNFSVVEQPYSKLDPDSLGDLGFSANEADALLRENWVLIETGPNKGVIYFTKVPVFAVTYVKIDSAALRVGSQFYNNQHGGGKYCPKDSVVPFLPRIADHEGTSQPLPPMSHAGVFRRELNARVPQPTEAAVALEYIDVAWRVAHDSALPRIEAARAVARDSIKGGIVPPVPYCVFRYH